MLLRDLLGVPAANEPSFTAGIARSEDREGRKRSYDVPARTGEAARPTTR
jgi:hypothetical protein